MFDKTLGVVTDLTLIQPGPLFSHLATFILALSISTMSTALILRIAVRMKLYDQPGGRKVHTMPVPQLGGVAIYLAFMLAVAVAMRIEPLFYYQFAGPFIGLFLGGAVVFMLGIFDDLSGSTASLKFSVQIVAATVLFFYGYDVQFLTNPFTGASIPLDPLTSWFVTTFWIVALCNAVNLIDGLDGLAAGVTSIVGVSFFIGSILRGDVVSSILSAAIAGASLGFLIHNFYPARIFMGDTGALTLGFMLGAISIQSASKSAAAVALIVPIAALMLPITDTGMAIVRRLLLGRHPFRADQDHIHHRLIKIGITHRNVVLILYGVTFYFCLLSVVLVLIPKQFGIVILGMILASAALGFRWINQIEIKKKDTENGVS